MADMIGNDPPRDSQELKSYQRMLSIQAKIEKILEKEKDLAALITVIDIETGYAMFSGSGCPLCSVIRIIEWATQNNIVHTHLTDEVEGNEIKH